MSEKRFSKTAEDRIIEEGLSLISSFTFEDEEGDLEIDWRSLNPFYRSDGSVTIGVKKPDDGRYQITLEKRIGGFFSRKKIKVLKYRPDIKRWQQY